MHLILSSQITGNITKYNFIFSENLQSYLRTQAEATKQHAYARGTIDNYWVQWNLFFNFCEYFDYACLPAQVNTLVEYVQFLDDKLKSPKSVKNYLSGVRKFHELLKADQSAFEDPELGVTIRGVVNKSQYVPSPAKAMEPETLKKIKSALDLQHHKHRVFWALCLTAFFILARKSNLVPNSLFDPNKQLARKHVNVLREQRKLTIHLHWSKTHRPSNGPVKYTIHEIQGSSLCAYSAIVQLYEQATDTDPDAPLFQWPDGSPVKYREFMKWLRKSLSEAEVDPKGDSTHSFRAGGATWAFNSGVPGEIIKILGNWKSDCYFRYLQISDEARAVASQLFGRHLLEC